MVNSPNIVSSRVLIKKRMECHCSDKQHALNAPNISGTGFVYRYQCRYVTRPIIRAFGYQFQRALILPGQPIIVADCDLWFTWTLPRNNAEENGAAKVSTVSGTRVPAHLLAWVSTNCLDRNWMVLKYRSSTVAQTVCWDHEEVGGWTRRGQSLVAASTQILRIRREEKSWKWWRCRRWNTK